MRGADRLCVVHCSYLLFSSTKAICASFTLHCVSYRMVSVPWPGAPGYYISFANGQFMFWLLVCLCTSRWARRKRTTQALTQPATSDQWAARTRKRRKRRRRRRLPHRNVYNYYIQSQQLMILCIKPVLILTHVLSPICQSHIHTYIVPARCKWPECVFKHFTIATWLTHGVYIYTHSFIQAKAYWLSAHWIEIRSRSTIIFQ